MAWRNLHVLEPRQPGVLHGADGCAGGGLTATAGHQGPVPVSVDFTGVVPAVSVVLDHEREIAR